MLQLNQKPFQSVIIVGNNTRKGMGEMDSPMSSKKKKNWCKTQNFREKKNELESIKVKKKIFFFFSFAPYN